MVIFALTRARDWPWSAAGAIGLLGAAIPIGRSLARTANPSTMLGIQGGRPLPWLVAIAAIAIGAAAGAYHRQGLGLPLWPAGGLEWFVIVACLIGAMEELLYRGWLLGRASAFGPVAAIVIAAAAHAAYKAALFTGPLAPASIDLPSMALWTFAGGIVLGALRVYSRNVLVPVLAHAAFDFMVYGAVAHAPWWVWS